MVTWRDSSAARRFIRPRRAPRRCSAASGSSTEVGCARPVRADHQDRRLDLQTTGDARLAGADRPDPACVDRPGRDRLPVEVEVPLADVVAVQAARIDTGHLARDLPHRVERADPVDDRECHQPGEGVAVHVDPRRVQEDAGDRVAAVVQPQRHGEPAGGVGGEHQVVVGLGRSARARGRAPRSRCAGRRRSSPSGGGAASGRTCGGRARRSHSPARPRSPPIPVWKK